MQREEGNALGVPFFLYWFREVLRRRRLLVSAKDERRLLHKRILGHRHANFLPVSSGQRLVAAKLVADAIHDGRFIPEDAVMQEQVECLL